MYYFASDFHLGYPDYQKSRRREELIVRWLDSIKKDARQLHLVGDIFDFWFEWKHVVPRNYVRFLGKLAQLADDGVEIHFYIGNHDIWTFGYLEQEIGLIVHRKPQIQVIEGKKFFIAHGDQTPYANLIYKIMTGVFRWSVAQRLFAALHPNFATWIATGFSQRRDRYQVNEKLDPVNDKQVRYIKWLKGKGYDADFYIFGHRHMAYKMGVEGSQLIVLGEWMVKNTYAVFDGKTLELKKFNAV